MNDDIYSYEIAVPDDGFNYDAASQAIDELTFEQVNAIESQLFASPGFESLAADDFLAEIRGMMREALESLSELPVKSIGGVDFVQALSTEEEMSDSFTDVDLLELIDGCEPVREALRSAQEIAPSIQQIGAKS
jgi:hypothetical protein